MAGRPMVATEVGGVPEVIMSPYGRLVPPGRPLELAEGICDMAADRTESGPTGASWAGRPCSTPTRSTSSSTATDGSTTRCAPVLPVH